MSPIDPPIHRRRTCCRSCSKNLGNVLVSLGDMPLANALSIEAEEAECFPLDVALCPSCGLVQLVDDIHPGKLFGDYPYLTGASDTMIAHFLDYAEGIAASLPASGRVLEIGCNDGALLRNLVSKGHYCLGVEPAQRAAQVARGHNIDIVEAFFGSQEADEALEIQTLFDVIVANNVLAHVDDPRAVLLRCRSLLKDSGRMVVEFPSARTLLEGGLWDTIYHEHRSYLSVGAMIPMARAAGFEIFRIERQTVHGGSLRVWMGPAGVLPEASVAQELAAESQMGVADPQSWLALAGRIDIESQALMAYLEGASGLIIAYGAPAKATVRLNRAGIGPALLPFLVDRNPFKVGRFVPGVNIPIRAVQALKNATPQGVLVMPWNLFGEISNQIEAYLPKDCTLLPVTALKLGR